MNIITNNENENESDNELVSSGDDLDYDRDNENFHVEQMEDANDIDQEMQFANEYDPSNDENSDNENESNLSQDEIEKDTKDSRKKKLDILDNFNFDEIEKQIDDNYSKKNDKVARLLNISKQYQNKKRKTQNNLYELNDSYSSDESDISDKSDVSYGSDDNNKIKNFGDVDKIEDINWGSKVEDYYGADTQKSKLLYENERSKYKELRDEELIGIQMQNEQLEKAKPNDFMDLEMLTVDMSEKEPATKNVEIENVENVTELKPTKKRKINKVTNTTTNDKEKVKDVNNLDIINVKNETNNSVEKIVKDRSHLKKNDKLSILKRDHPELIGILKDLNDVVKELKDINKNRLRAIKAKFDDGIRDCTLFLDANRTYAALLAFYLRLKACGESENKRDIGNEMLKLKKQIFKLRVIYNNSILILNKLYCKDWDCKWYILSKSLIKKEIKNKEHLAMISKKNAEMEIEKEERKKKYFERLNKIHKQEIKRQLVENNMKKMNNWDSSLGNENNYDDLSRRQITQKIFKTKGLTRYRTKGIPRVKKKRKYERKMRLWKKKGYKPYTGKIPNGWAERNINLGTVHSVQFR